MQRAASRQQQDLADVAARLHQRVRLVGISGSKGAVNHRADTACLDERPDLAPQRLGEAAVTHMRALL